MNLFSAIWKNTATKRTIVDELKSQGTSFDVLKEEVGKELDPFDLLCHIAYDAKPLTRRERLDKVKKRNDFTKYGKKAQAVIKSLLDEYVVDGLLSMDILRLDPIAQLGSSIELVKAFGGKKGYKDTRRQYEN